MTDNNLRINKWLQPNIRMTNEQRDELMLFMERGDVRQLWDELGQPLNYFRYAIRLKSLVDAYGQECMNDKQTKLSKEVV